MDYNNHNTTLRTNKHLNFEERFYLEKRIVIGDSITVILRALGRSRTTIYTELNCGTQVVSEETIQRTLKWCNNLPRKILNYRTPLDVFLEEVNKFIDLDTVQFHIAI